MRTEAMILFLLLGGCGLLIGCDYAPLDPSACSGRRRHQFGEKPTAGHDRAIARPERRSELHRHAWTLRTLRTLVPCALYLSKLRICRRRCFDFSRRERAAISSWILPERATRKNRKSAPALWVAMKMGWRLRCGSVTAPLGDAPSPTPCRQPILIATDAKFWGIQGTSLITPSVTGPITRVIWPEDNRSSAPVEKTRKTSGRSVPVTPPSGACGSHPHKNKMRLIICDREHGARKLVMNREPWKDQGSRVVSQVCDQECLKLGDQKCLNNYG